MFGPWITNIGHAVSVDICHNPLALPNRDALGNGMLADRPANRTASIKLSATGERWSGGQDLNLGPKI